MGRSLGWRTAPTNGGHTPKTKFKVRGISSDLRDFFGVGDVALSLNKLKLGEYLKGNLFPIDCDSFGNYINTLTQGNT